MTTVEPTVGWDLVAAHQGGDRTAFGQLYQQYQPVVFRYLLFRLADRPLAEDLTADTFVRALQAMDRLIEHTGRDVGAWFVTIARNLMLDHHKRSRTRLTTPIGPGEPFWETAGEAPALPEQRVIEQETVDQIDRLVSALNPYHQEVIRHRFYSGLSGTETAELMGIAVGTVRSAQSRAVRNLARGVRPARSINEFNGLAR